jgi:hypothetical protein
MRLVAVCMICAIQPSTADAASKISERYRCQFDDAVTQIIEIDTVGKSARTWVLFRNTLQESAGPWRVRVIAQAYTWKDTKRRDVLAKATLYSFDRGTNTLLATTTFGGSDPWQRAASCVAFSR